MTDAFITTLPHRAVIAITGADARTFLQRVITHGPEGLAPQAAQFSALLTPQGKVMADFILFDHGEDGLFVDAPASEVQTLLKRFTLYRMRAEAEITLREDLSVIAAKGDGEAELKMVALSQAQDPRHSDLGLRAIAPEGGPDSDLEAYHTARIQTGVPEFGHDYGGSQVFSTDVNHDLLSGIDYKKGCFVGQEVASRMHRKGGVRKRTVRLSADAKLTAGQPILVGDTNVGALTSTSRAWALALVRVDRVREGVEAGGALHVDQTPVQLMDDLSAL